MDSIFKSIVREYEQDRLIAEKRLAAKKTLIYQRVPRIEAIDTQLNRSGLLIAKKILAKAANPEELVVSLEETQQTLLQERRQLLRANGFQEADLVAQYRCVYCKDTGFVGNVKCTCFKQKLINRYYDISNLGAILQFENFDTFNINYYAQEIAPNYSISPRENIKLIYQSCNEFLHTYENDLMNLLFYGSSGLGKTFLCNCIAKDFLNFGHTVLYVTSPQLFKAIEDARFHRDELENPDEYVNMIYNVDLLIIDDLGTEIQTVVTNSELFNMMNYRILERKPTVISTNLDLGNFDHLYSDRITSRFYGHYKMHHFFGDDIRVLKKYRQEKK